MTRTIPRLVAIDTQILIFSLRLPTGDAEQDDLMCRSKRLMRDMLKAETRVMISMITLSEYLVKIPQAQKMQVAQDLASSYEIALFNIRAAVLAADLVPFGKQLVDGDRDVIMADTKIIASIAAAKCPRVYTHDTGSKFAQICHHAGLEVRGLPAQSEFVYDTEDDSAEAI